MNKKLAILIAAANAAQARAPGPWKCETFPLPGGEGTYTDVTYCAYASERFSVIDAGEAIDQYIAAASPDVILELVALLQQLTTQRERVLELIGENGCDCDCDCAANAESHAEDCVVCWPCAIEKKLTT